MITKIGVGASLPVEIVKRIDKIRGEVPRSKILRDLIERGLKVSEEIVLTYPATNESTPEHPAVGILDRNAGVVFLGDTTFLEECAQIQIPESLVGAPDQALVFVTPAGLLAWEYKGKLVTRFDHIND